MKATRSENGWLIQPENNKEKIALVAFLNDHKRDQSASISEACLAEADTHKPIVPLLHPAETEAEPPSHGRGWPPAAKPHSNDHDLPSGF